MSKFSYSAEVSLTISHNYNTLKVGIACGEESDTEDLDQLREKIDKALDQYLKENFDKMVPLVKKAKERMINGATS